MNASYYGRVSGLQVTEEMHRCHPQHVDYPLLPGDILKKREDGTYGKFGPGLGIEGFVLTAEQEAALRPIEDVPFGMGGMDYFLGGGE